MTEATISRYPVPDINDLPEDLKSFIVAMKEKAASVKQTGK